MNRNLLTPFIFSMLALFTGPGWAQQPKAVPEPGHPMQIGGHKPQPINTHGSKQQWLDVAYATNSQAQKLDIYLPNEGKGPFPVILAIHGGGFVVGDKRTGEVNPEMAGLTRGYAVVCVNYRLSGEAVFPAAVQDLKAAVRFLRAHAQTYHLNPGKIVAWGDSAGGNLASMLGTSAGVKELEDLSLGHADQPSHVQAVVDFFGPTDFAAMDSQFAKAGVSTRMKHDGADSAESRYMGFQVSKDPTRARKGDPSTYISAQTCPFFIANGTEDRVVPPQQNADFAAALEKAIGKDKVSHIVLKNMGHGGPGFEAPATLDKVFAFLAKHLQ